MCLIVNKYLTNINFELESVIVPEITHNLCFTSLYCLHALLSSLFDLRPGKKIDDFALINDCHVVRPASRTARTELSRVKVNSQVGIY